MNSRARNNCQVISFANIGSMRLFGFIQFNFFGYKKHILSTTIIEKDRHPWKILLLGQIIFFGKNMSEVKNALKSPYKQETDGFSRSEKHDFLEYLTCDHTPGILYL